MTARDDVGSALARFAKAVAEKDVKTLVDCYEADGIVLAPNRPMVRGSSALGDLFQNDIVDAGVTAIDFDTTDLVEDGSLVVIVGRNLVHMALPDGGSIADPGKYLVVYRRQADGSLKLVFDAFSSDSTPR